ncbi:hypothetical protein Cfor_00962 [Coptotermes formosanus]|jgi:hypothetical protein|uniref:Reverse transcriptase domain-containing protein n=1 Tax=Coptotermes formosanus TaxID=36987 RepID=A0A6L2Q7P6_COPFO|nr:hypothetical protein Cfor_00962 [Coptotermes formosanus]
MPIEQAGFRKELGTRDKIANVRWIMERTRESNKLMSLCFIDYPIVFDSVEHLETWNSKRSRGIPEQFIALIRDLYTSKKPMCRSNKVQQIGYQYKKA